MKKIISLLLVLVMVFSMTVFASAAGNSFTDIYNSKNEDAIEFLYDLGLVEGYSVTKFGPKKNLTRAEACALIVRALIEDDEIYASAKDNFVDVDDYAWYREWVDTAYRNHIMHGYGNGVFGPEDHVTYAQYATILVNALGYDSLDFEGTWPTNVEGLAVKLDLYDNVSRHVSDDEITREDAAQMLYNALWCKMVGMRGVTLYDVVTEKYAPKIVTVGPVMITIEEVRNGWVKFHNGIQSYWCDIDDFYTHDPEVNHSDWVYINFNADYSEIYTVKYIACVEEEDVPEVAPAYVTGVVEEIYRNDDDTINYIVIDGKGKHYFADEYTYDNVDNTGFVVGIECEVTVVDNEVIHIKFWKPVTEEFNGLMETGGRFTKYVVNTNTLKFHSITCTHISNIADEHRVNVANSYLSLRYLGYVPCMDCKPE